tara:strand:- start:695 stop:1252 length:558 start_codon:yes stop_codon:yes gene_type:complete
MLQNIILRESDILFLQNGSLKKMENINWGKTVSIINEYIQQSILEYLEFDCKTNEEMCGSGYDLLLDNKIKIQCKIRQVEGQTPYSKAVHFSTTRRKSIKNIDKCKTGQVCYTCSEFDYVFVSLVHKGMRDLIDWKFALIPVQELIGEGDNLVTSISSKLLEKYKVTSISDINLLLRPCQLPQLP